MTDADNIGRLGCKVQLSAEPTNTAKMPLLPLSHSTANRSRFLG